jgi:hypothetical protein
MRPRGRIRRSSFVSLAAIALLAGCGKPDFEDKPREAIPVQLTGVITNARVTISPHKVGAGPIVIIISNQTQRSHTITLDGAGIPPVRVGPVNPADTAQIQKTLRPGHYVVRAGSEAAVPREIKPAMLDIGKPRPNSNNRVLLP